MDAIRPRLHPLLTVAAISVTVLSAVGVGAMTGLLPHSSGTTKDAEPVVVAAPAQPQQNAIERSMPAAAIARAVAAAVVVTYASCLPLVSGMKIHMTAENRNAPDRMKNPVANPRVCASELRRTQSRDRFER